MPPEDCRHYQHSWDELLYEHHFSSLLDSASDARTKARLLSVSVCIIQRHGTEWHIPWHYSPERNRADTRVPQRINYSISYLVACNKIFGPGA